MISGEFWPRSKSEMSPRTSEILSATAGSSRPRFSRKRLSIDSEMSIPVTLNPRRASGIATRPVPQQSSSTRPPWDSSASS